ncbi:hypothetical protein [Ligilactobacillus acidipiscis]|nr:hypothetical protein [Ligilactobacillus acidipiscis]
MEVDANKIISNLASRIASLETENAVLQAQLEAEAKESGDKNGKQDTKS